MINFSTDPIREHERFSYWREVVCRALLNVTTESPGQRFSARIGSRTYGNMRFAHFESASHELVRSERDIERRPEDSYIVTLQQRGKSRFTQGGQTCALEQNEISILDGRLPFRATYCETVTRAVAILPHKMVDDRAPWLRAHPKRKIMTSSPFADLVASHLRLLTDPGRPLTEAEATALSENLCNLLALATSPATAPSKLAPELLLESIQAYCRKNLHETELSATSVAARFGMSVRTLHLRFHKTGRSFGRWLLDTRLEACDAALRDPRQWTCNISEIAYRCGFNDLSYFNKAFRARFGMPPGQRRVSAIRMRAGADGPLVLP